MRAAVHEMMFTVEHKGGALQWSGRNRGQMAPGPKGGVTNPAYSMCVGVCVFVYFTRVCLICVRVHLSVLSAVVLVHELR